jgi:hypothetical protein
MGYKQTPLNVLKGQMTNKATGLMMKDSVAYMADSPLNEIDPKTGDRISREAKLKLEAGAELAKKNLAQRAIDEMKGGLYEDTTSTLPGLKPKRQAKSYGERQVEKAMETQTYKDTDKKISKADAQLLQVFDPVRPQYEAFEKQFGKGATPNKPFIAEDYAKGVSAKDVKLRQEMNYAATQPMTIQKKGLAKPTAKELGGYQTRQTLSTEAPKMAPGSKATFVQGGSEMRVMRDPASRGDQREFRAYTRGASGEASKETQKRKRKQGTSFSQRQSLQNLSKAGRGEFVLKGTNPYLPRN